MKHHHLDKPNPGTPPVPMKPGVELICSKCKNPRKNDTYGTVCEDCYCERVYSQDHSRPFR